MKTTTYLLAGLILGSLLSIVLGVAVCYQFSVPHKSQELHLTGAHVTQALPPCRVLQIRPLQQQGENCCLPTNNYYNRSFLRVTHTDTPEPQFHFPASFHDFITVTRQADTVCINVHISEEERMRHVNKPHQPLWVVLDSLHLELPSTVEQLEVGLMGIPVQLSSLQQDSLSCTVDGSLSIRSSRFRSLSVQADAAHFQSGRAESLHLHLNSLRDWTVHEDFHVDTEYLYGSHEHHSYVGRNECQSIRWVPTHPDARLSVTLNQAAEITLVP